MLTDAAAYMKKCGLQLQVLYKKMIHVLCVVHGLQRICVEAMDIFEQVKEWLYLLKEVIIALKSIRKLKIHLCILYIAGLQLISQTKEVVQGYMSFIAISS
jgi:hypothetical protein